MLADVQAHFGFKRPLYGVGVFETDHQRTVVREVCSAVQTGRLVLLSGLVGSGKTHLLARTEDELTRAGRVAVSRSLAVPRKSLRDFAEKTRVTLSTLIEALFYDLGDKNVVIPKPPEKRERELRDLVRKARRPVVLIVDEAQDLHPKTLTGLKRLMEVVAGGGGLLSMLLAAHPKLRIDLRRPDMEQVGYRTSVFEYDGVAGHQRDYMAWLLAACAEDGVKVADVIDADALDLLAQKLRTPLQDAEQRSQRDRDAPGAGLRGGVPRQRQAGTGRDRRRRAQPRHRRPGAAPHPQRLRRGNPRARVRRQARRDPDLSGGHAGNGAHPRTDRPNARRRRAAVTDTHH